ncbi:type I-E CRISPR-associated protein Cas5/CasD [Endozoicomonas sp. ONNA1]|uniref:type I-E CRISPR-associated protein Cas5/CasD n=1 Tax=Endozoicomonas sp. ONNA1 TaxID=2828740 RepID=UPI0021483103|nr:type I-E CRISPR-associated protein Cas5/CasD [Endozoicomonas sp. ONNA1]
MNYLLFRLYGPMASWGEIALGENRHSATYPGKSAILGLLGAALGIRRDDETGQQALMHGYSLAVKQMAAGGFLRDYHTVQAPKSGGKFAYRTRRDEVVLGRERLGPLLSSREYRTDALAVVAVKANEQARWSLQQLRDALLKPRFHLYLGRKACPLAAPLQPELITAGAFLQALDRYQPKPLLRSKLEWVTDQRFLKPDSTWYYYWQGELADFAAPDRVPLNQIQQLVRHDQPLSRQRWQFQPRKENLWLSKPTSKEGS